MKLWIVVYLEGSYEEGEDSQIGDVEVYTTKPDDGIYNDTRAVFVFEKEIEITK